MAAPTFTLTQAVNSLLRSVTQFQLSVYPSFNPGPDENAAGQAIAMALTALQAKGEFAWATQGDAKYWPTVKTVTADAITGEISMQPSVDLLYFVMQAHLHPNDSDYGKKVVDIREDGGIRKLFDVTNGTFDWGVGAVKTLKITYSLDFMELPPPAQLYVMADAKVRFLEDRQQDPSMIAQAERRRIEAMDDLVAWDMRQDPVTLWDAPEMTGLGIMLGGEPTTIRP